MNVLLATDGSERSSIAERLAASLPWPPETRVEVMRVAQAFASDRELPPDAYRALQASIRREIRSHLARVRTALSASGREVTTKTLRGRPASAIVNEARRTRADVVILGSRGQGPIASALLGSVAAEVVDRAPCPVLVARTSEIRGIVIADDGSDGSIEAEELLGSWTFLHGVPTRAVSVAELVPFYAGFEMGGAPAGAQTYQIAFDELRRLHQGYASSAVARLQAHGIAAVAEVRDGSAANELITAAGDVAADLIVIGSRGRTGLARLVLGSVARSVLFHSPVSVLIVRPSVAVRAPVAS